MPQLQMALPHKHSTISGLCELFTRFPCRLNHSNGPTVASPRYSLIPCRWPLTSSIPLQLSLPWVSHLSVACFLPGSGLRKCCYCTCCCFTSSTQKNLFTHFSCGKLRFREATLFFQLVCDRRDSNLGAPDSETCGLSNLLYQVSQPLDSLPVSDNKEHNKIFKISVIYEHMYIHSPNTFWASDHYELGNVLITESIRRGYKRGHKK